MFNSYLELILKNLVKVFLKDEKIELGVEILLSLEMCQKNCTIARQIAQVKISGTKKAAVFLETAAF